MPNISLEDMLASQRPATAGRLSLEDMLAEQQDPEYGWLDTAITTGLRIVPSALGSLGGGLAGAAAGGAPSIPGTIAGGAAGGAIGDWLAQKYEQARGLRKDTSVGSIVAEGILGGIPLGKSATLLRAAGKGAGMGAGGSYLHSGLEEGDWSPNLDELAVSGVFGAGFGAGAEKLGQMYTARRTPRIPTSAAADAPAGYGERNLDDIAARHAAVERDPIDAVIDEIVQESYRFEDGQPRYAAREPQPIAPAGSTRVADDGYDPQRIVSPLQHEADAIAQRERIDAREPNRYLPRTAAGREWPVDQIGTIPLAGDELDPASVIARQLGIEPPPRTPPPPLGDEFPYEQLPALPPRWADPRHPRTLPPTIEPDLEAAFPPGRLPSPWDPNAPRARVLPPDTPTESLDGYLRGRGDAPPPDADILGDVQSGLAPRDDPFTGRASLLDDLLSGSRVAREAPAAPAPRPWDVSQRLRELLGISWRSPEDRLRDVQADVQPWPTFRREPSLLDELKADPETARIMNDDPRSLSDDIDGWLAENMRRSGRIVERAGDEPGVGDLVHAAGGRNLPTFEPSTFEPGQSRAEFRAATNADALARYKELFSPLQYQAIEDFARRNPRVFATLNFEDQRAISDKATTIMMRGPDDQPLTTIRLGRATPDDTLEQWRQTIEHEARHAVDNRGRPFRELIDENAREQQLPYLQRPSERRAFGFQDARARKRGAEPWRPGSNRGEIGGELAQTLGGGAAGALLGATYGDTPEEHMGGAAAGFAAGAAGGSAFSRFLRNRPKPPQPEFYHERPLPKPGTPIKPITHAGLPTGRYVVENQNQIFEFEPNNALPRRQAMPASQAADLGLDNFPEESRDAIQDVLSTFAPEEIAKQRGGRQPMAHTEALARRMKLDAEEALAPGRNLSRAGHMAYAKAFEATAMEARELALKGKTGDGLNEREQARLLMLDQANRALGMSYLGLRSEAGGALNVYRHLKRLMPGEVRLLTEMIERGRLHKNMADLQNLYADLPNDPVKAFEKLREIESTRRGVSDKIADYYTANILSGVKTQLRNLFGNAARLASRLPAKASAGALDAFLSSGGRPREVYAREVQHEIAGAVASLERAFRDGIETFKLGFSKEGLDEGLEDMSSLYIPRPEMKLPDWMGGAKGLKNPLNWPGRVMGGVDRFFRQINMSMELYGETYARARREAEKQGLDGAAFTDHVAKRVAEMRMNPDNALKRRVAKAAERAVYQDDPGPAINALSSFVRHVPGARFVVPFIGTIKSILQQGAIDFGPAGFLTKRSGLVPRKLKPGEVAPELRDMMLSRGEAMMGTLALGPIALLAATGRMSGAGPTDPAKREALYETGWRPHSIRVPAGVLGDGIGQLLGASRSDDGDWWVNYTLAQPIAVQAAIVANGFEAWQEAADRNGAGGEQIITSTIMRAAQSAFDQSFLSGVGDLIDAINDPSQGQKYFGRLAQGFLPMSGLMRNVAQTVDPVVRQPEGILEHLAANTPGLSTTVDPRLNRWGEDVTRTGTAALFAPEAQPSHRDPIADELSRLGVNVGIPSDRLEAPRALGGGRIPMDSETALEIRRFKGRTTRALLHAVVGGAGYENAPDVVRAEMLRRAIREASSHAGDAARMSLLLERPDLLRLLAEPMEEAAAASYPAR